MKKVNRFTMLALMATAIFFSCKTKGPKDWIVSKWKLTDLKGKPIEEMGDSLKNIYIKSFVI